MNPVQRRQWRMHVGGHPDLTLAQRHVLQMLEVFADYPDGTNARPGVAMLAETCRLKHSVVESALASGRRLKLIKQTARANPKRGLAATYRLVSIPTVVGVDSEFQPPRNDISTPTGWSPPDHYTRSLHQLTPRARRRCG
jgi:hypothetical protein